VNAGHIPYSRAFFLWSVPTVHYIEINNEDFLYPGMGGWGGGIFPVYVKTMYPVLHRNKQEGFLKITFFMESILQRRETYRE
jgi:hypothetical protein